MSITSKKSVGLLDWEISMIDIFVRAAGLIGLPKSIGEIYGLLYCSRKSLTFDELVEGLRISKGSVSQGLKLLRQLGAIKLHYVPGSRRDHYQPELSMKSLVRGFIKDQFEPHMLSGSQRIEGLKIQIADESDETIRKHALLRLNTLQSWQQRARKLLPIVLAVLGGAKFLENEDSEGRTII